MTSSARCAGSPYSNLLRKRITYRTRSKSEVGGLPGRGAQLELGLADRESGPEQLIRLKIEVNDLEDDGRDGLERLVEGS